MVVKRRSNSSDRLILPLIQVYNEKEQNNNTIVITASQHHCHKAEDDFPSTFWGRRSSSSHLSQISESKKHDTLPSWGNPQDDLYERPHPKRKDIIPSKRKRADKLSLATFFVVLLGGFTCTHLKSVLNTNLSEINTVLAHRNDLKVKLRAGDKDIRMLSREIATTKHRRQMEDYSRGTDQSNKRSIDVTKLKGMKNQVNSFNERKATLKELVRTRSRQSVESTYGVGKTIQVEFTLDFPDGKEGPNTVMVEMASLESMPTAVFTFLSMMEQSLWDGTSILMPANHIMMAAPMSYDETRDSTAINNAFQEANLNGPVFKEYNDEFLHSPYTLSFAGRGSPSFYISAEKNADLHPSDAAFAKVVAGFDTLARMESVPVVAGTELRNRVGIRSTRVLASSNRSLRPQR